MASNADANAVARPWNRFLENRVGAPLPKIEQIVRKYDFRER